MLDFFSGTGTTGHAVLKQNAEDQGNRKFILVQLPVALETAESNLKTITDVTLERVRNYGQTLRAAGNKGDTGFRFYRVARSNFTKYRPKTASSLADLPTLDFHGTGSLIPDYKTADVITELMLLEGFPLDSQVVQAAEFDDVVQVVSHPERSYRLLVCLSTDPLMDGTVDEAVKYPDDTFVCLDASLTDELKIRLADAVKKVKTI